MVFCFAVVVDLTTGLRLCTAKHSHLVCSMDEKSVMVSLLNFMQFGPAGAKYRVPNMDGLWVNENRLALRFKKPKHMLIALTQDSYQVRSFVSEISDWTLSRNMCVRLDGDFNPRFDNYVAPLQFDRALRMIPDVRHLSKLVLENSVLSTLPIDGLPVAYLSLNGSKLGTTSREHDFFWDWMTMDSVRDSLMVLEMNDCNLERIPFEVLSLKNLEVLSVANNRLKNLPHYLCELKNIRSLFINDNQLESMPGCFQDIIFEYINISNNNFSEEIKLMDLANRRLKRKKGKMHCLSLFNLSLFTFFDNFELKRQYIPFSFWPFIDQLSRCQFCDKWVLPDHTTENFNQGFIKSYFLINNNRCIPWQYFDCSHKCSNIPNYVDLELNLT